MQDKQAPFFTWFEFVIVLAIIGLLAAIAIPNYLRARHEHDIREKGLYSVDVASGNLASLANKFGSVGIGDGLLSILEVIGDSRPEKSDLLLVSLERRSELMNSESTNGDESFRDATMRELISLVMDQSSYLPMRTNMIALGSKVLVNNNPLPFYPIVLVEETGNAFRFGYDRPWPSNTLFVIVKVPKD